ncbi:restriction endonuclease subunit S [Vibrio syngnathi]|uniref:Type-1 restriction enzyme EcoKI specificity protein n=1 Tax=Vibrio syngnathi TaxID=3034029 RepID=A0AA34TQ84_9VIBR|nr:restriction endonuclease subunit S [Vibrio syngnathi]ARP38123.1 Type-1 restriction enzyme EcoKI specificity protein [Vibrio syngnathi]
MSDLPKGWADTTISDITDYVQRGKGPKYAEKNSFPVVNQKAVRWFGLQEEHLKYVREDTWDKYTPERFIQVGDILWNSTGTGTIGRACLLDEAEANKAKVVDSHVTIVRPNTHIEPRYLFAWIRSPKVQHGISSLSTGTTNQVELSKSRVLETKIPLAPLNEQIRIANKLDSILAKVDKAQARLDKIPAILKRFRQSVLAGATSGELTKAWRESKDLHWEVTSFGKLIKNGPQNGIYKPSKLYGSGTKIIRIDGFYDGKLSPWESIKSVQLENDELAKWKLKVDDILINRVNSIEYLGKCGHVDSLPEDAVFESNIMRVELDKSLANPLFIKHFLSSPIGLMRLRANAKHAVNQASINQTDVKSVEIHLPNIEEQKLIVELVEAFLDKANKVEKQYLDAKARLDRLTQSILAKAFRGELVPQDPTDEPAEQLLERILKEREQVAPKKTTRKRTTKAKTAEKG